MSLPAPTLAWECSGTSIEGAPETCVVYAQRRSQANKVAFNHGPGFDMLDYIDIRCRRRPDLDGTEPEGAGPGIGMYGEEGRWHHESFRHYGKK